MFDYEKFEQFRKAKGVSVDEVIKSTGIESATLYSWKAKCEGRFNENGKPIGYFPKADKILKLAKYFDCSMEDFAILKE